MTLLVVDDELAIDGEPWHRASVHCSRLIRAFDRVSVERLTFSAGATADEVESLLAGLVGSGDLDIGVSWAAIGGLAGFCLWRVLRSDDRR